MDPKIIAALKARMAQGQGAPQGAPQVPPQGPQRPPQAGPSAGGNPFMKFVQQAGPSSGADPMSAMAGMMGGGAGPAQPPTAPPQGPQGPMLGPDGKPQPDQLQPGQNPDKSKPLTMAISALQQYIAQATDRDEIATARSVIALLGQLIQKDQATMAQKLPPAQG